MNQRYNAIIELRRKGLTFPQIRNELKIPLSTISKVCKSYGLNVNPKHRPINDEEIINWQRMYDDGSTVEQVALFFKRSRNTVRVRINTRKRSFRSLEEQKQYMSKYIGAHKRRIKQILVKEHGGKCVRCGYDRNIKALQFHHINPKEKEFSLSQTTRSLQSARKEMKKCILLCANCHVEVEHEIFISK